MIYLIIGGYIVGAVLTTFVAWEYEDFWVSDPVLVVMLGAIWPIVAFGLVIGAFRKE